MAQLGMTDREFEQYQLYMSEAVRLIGQDAQLFPVGAVVRDLYSDTDVTYLNPVDVGLLFDTNPRPILKKFQWLTEDEELPYLAYLVSLDHSDKEFTVKEQMKIKICSERVLASERLFIVTNVRGVTLDPLMWICKLVPWRPKVDLVPETPEYNSTITKKSDGSFSYLKEEL